MLNWSQRKVFARILLVLMCVPVCLAGTCPGTTPPPPPPPGNTVIFNGNLATSAGNAFDPALACPPPAGGARGFVQTFNAAAGKLVTISVTGPTANSRPQIRVIENPNTQVANTGPSPTSQTNTTTFTPTAANIFAVQVQECAAVAIGSVYSVQISQAP
jgi:hypothetical protein